MRRDLSSAGGADTDQRLRDMASDGVIAEVIYPTFGLFIDLIPDAELQMACAAIYNDALELVAQLDDATQAAFAQHVSATAPG